MKSNRVEYVDALRGMTMILVVYSHIAVWSFSNVNMAFNDVFIKFRMPTFFFISGWVFYKVGREWNKDTIYCILKKKFMVQIIPFLFFMFLFMYLFSGPEYQSPEENKYGYWFTLSLFEYFVIYIGIEALFNKHNVNKKELIIMLILLIISISAFTFEHIKFYINLGILGRILIFLSFSKMKFIIFFWLGTFIKKNFTAFNRLTDQQYFIPLCMSIFLILLIGPCINTHFMFNYISFLFSGITGIIIVFTFFRKNETIFLKRKRIGYILQYIGQRTLDIYLIHFFFLPYHMKTIGAWLSHNSYKSIDMFILLMISLWIVAISLFVSNIIRLSPFLGHYLFGVKRS